MSHVVTTIYCNVYRMEFSVNNNNNNSNDNNNNNNNNNSCVIIIIIIIIIPVSFLCLGFVVNQSVMPVEQFVYFAEQNALSWGSAAVYVW